MEENIDMSGKNGSISDKLINCIKDEKPKPADPSKELQGVLKEILNSQIQISIDGMGHVLDIEPYWCEFYFRAGASPDPFCDDNPIKNENDHVYFRHFSYNKEAKSHRNRMDICLGNKDYQVSILLKRAKVTKAEDSSAEINIKKDDIYSSDSLIAKAVLTALGGGESFEKGSKGLGKITYKLLPHQHIKEDKIAFAQRIRLPKDKDSIDSDKRIGLSENKEKKNEEKADGWLNKKYAFFDADTYTAKLHCTAEAIRRAHKD